VSDTHGTPRLSPHAASSATSPVAAPVVLVELDFASGPFRAWTGLGQLNWAGKVFEGVGSIGTVGEVEETVDLRAVRLTLALSPVPQEVVDIALAERSFRLRPVRLWGALLDAEGAFVADPFPPLGGAEDGAPGGKLSGSRRQVQPARSTWKMALAISRSGQARRRPRRGAPGSSGSRIRHSSSVRSLA
jgi:hypothetical protein